MPILVATNTPGDCLNTSYKTSSGSKLVETTSLTVVTVVAVLSPVTPPPPIPPQDMKEHVM